MQHLPGVETHYRRYLPLFPAAAASIAPQLAQRDPAATLTWAQTLAAPAASDDQLREAVCAAVGR